MKHSFPSFSSTRISKVFQPIITRTKVLAAGR